MENNYQELLTFIEAKTGFRCANYKERPLKRRLMVRLRALDIKDYDTYLQYIKQHPDEVKLLTDVLTINLSYFFRNPETFDFIKRELFPLFKKDNRPLLFWSAGCANGEEPYSLAILAAESGILERTTVYATDIDRDALDKAQSGRYQNIAFQYLDQRLKNTYFTPDGNYFTADDRIKKHVIFKQHDIFGKFPYGNCDLIMCRNVLIYLDRNAQSIIINNFFQTLNNNGFLILGKVELLIAIPTIRQFKLISRSEHIYQKGQIV